MSKKSYNGGSTIIYTHYSATGGTWKGNPYSPNTKTKGKKLPPKQQRRKKPLPGIKPSETTFNPEQKTLAQYVSKRHRRVIVEVVKRRSPQSN